MREYFAYGSNMDPERMKARGVSYTSRRYASLMGFRLTFRKQSSRRNSEGYATIERDAYSKVDGVVYKIDPTSEVKLDRCEGSPAHYVKELVTVLKDGEIPTGAYVYVARIERLRDGL